MNKDKRNERYSVFSELASELGANVYLANYDRYRNSTISEAYRWNGDRWVKEREVELDVIFDKFKFDGTTRDLKKQMREQLPVLNSFELEELCKDKLLTYEKFSEHVPETRFAEPENVSEFLETDGKTVLKPRFGFGGKGVRILEQGEDWEESPDLLVQRYVQPASELPHVDFHGAHDFRVMVVNGDIMASYYRLNEEGDRANSSFGAEKQFVDVESIPEEVERIVREIDDELGSLKPAAYSVDFMFDQDKNPWIVELNSKPGLGVESEQEKEHRLPVMKQVVEILVDMAQS